MNDYSQDDIDYFNECCPHLLKAEECIYCGPLKDVGLDIRTCLDCTTGGGTYHRVDTGECCRCGSIRSQSWPA